MEGHTLQILVQVLEVEEVSMVQVLEEEGEGEECISFSGAQEVGEGVAAPCHVSAPPGACVQVPDVPDDPCDLDDPLAPGCGSRCCGRPGRGPAGTSGG